MNILAEISNTCIFCIGNPLAGFLIKIEKSVCFVFLFKPAEVTRLKFGGFADRIHIINL